MIANYNFQAHVQRNSSVRAAKRAL